MGERRLVVVADDFGLTLETSRSIVRAHLDGVVTATSVMGNGRSTGRSMRFLAGAPTLEVGLHAVLVGEDPPLLSAPEIPTLVGHRGHLASSWRTFVPRLVAGRVDPADIRREIAAQLAFVRSGAGPVTHINLHQHLHLWPTVRTTVLDLAGAEGIGYVRTPSSARLGPFGAAIRRLARATAAEVASRGLATSDGFLGLDEAGRWDSASLAAAIASSGSAVVELNAHPGPAFDPHRARYAWQYHWGAEFDALTDPGTRGIIGRVGFRLVGPSQIEATVPAPAN